MKKTLAALGAIALLNLAGCYYPKMHTCKPSPAPVVQHQTSHSGFADEEYVWESWWFGTNRVYKLDELDK